MSARRFAVLVGSHDPAYFASHAQSGGPREAAVLSALRAQHSNSEANHRTSATHTVAGDARSIARHADAGSGRRQGSASGGPPRMAVFAAAVGARRPTRHLSRAEQLWRSTLAGSSTAL
jgi:hypothetical protein